MLEYRNEDLFALRAYQRNSPHEVTAGMFTLHGSAEAMLLISATVPDPVLDSYTLRAETVVCREVETLFIYSVMEWNRR